MAQSSSPWDAVFKEVLLLLLGQAGATVTTEQEVGRLPRTIDGVAVCDTMARAWLAEHTPLDFLNEYTQLEGKSAKDSFTPQEYQRVMGRAYLYQAQIRLEDLSQFTVCVVSAGFPRKVLLHVPKLVRFQPVRKALWRAEIELPFYVLVCSELDVIPQNYPFLLFATGRKRREFLQALVQEAGSPYLPLAFALYPRTVMEELKMSRKLTKYEEELRYVIDQLGPETIVRLLPPESLAQAIEAQPPATQTRMIDALLERPRMIDALLERLDPDDLEARLQARRGQRHG